MYFLALFLYYFGVEKDRPQETAGKEEGRMTISSQTSPYSFRMPRTMEDVTRRKETA